MEVINFNVIVKHSSGALVYIGQILGQNHITTHDLRETDIVMDDDGSKVDEVYIICCKGSENDFERIKVRYFKNDEIMYEGLKSLI